MDYAVLEHAAEKIRNTWPDANPACGLILGSGWSDVVEAFNVKDTLAYETIPGLGKPGVAGHSGRLAWVKGPGPETLIFQGRRHYYEGEGWTPVAVPVYALRKLGVSKVLLTNAAGVIKPGLKPGDLMIIDDHINNMPNHPLVGPHNEVWGPRFPDQSAVYDPALRGLLDKAAKTLGEDIHHGVYLASTGPTYETPAEIRAYQAIGADAVGMSTVPEAILASAAGIRVAGLSCATNFAAGMSPTPLSHEEVTEATQAAMPRMKALLAQFWKELAATSP